MQKNERTRRVWEPTYTMIYGDACDNNELPQTVNKKVAEMNDIPENVAQVSPLVLICLDFWFTNCGNCPVIH